MELLFAASVIGMVISIGAFAIEVGHRVGHHSHGNTRVVPRREATGMTTESAHRSYFDQNFDTDGWAPRRTTN